MSNSLWPHESQHARPPCPSPTPGVYPNSCPLSLPLSQPLMVAIQPSHPLSSPSPSTSIFPSIRVFFNESALRMRWPKNWSSSFSILFLWIFRVHFIKTHWFDLLAVQGTFKSLLQYHSSNESILWCLAFFIVQLSHPYMTTGKATDGPLLAK